METFQLLGVLVASVHFWREIFHLSTPLVIVWQEFRLLVLSDLGGFLAVNKVMLPNLSWHIYLLLCL